VVDVGGVTHSEEQAKGDGAFQHWDGSRVSFLACLSRYCNEVALVRHDLGRSRPPLIGSKDIKVLVITQHLAAEKVSL
jgi:hypothetical protein